MWSYPKQESRGCVALAGAASLRVVEAMRRWYVHKRGCVEGGACEAREKRRSVDARRRNQSAPMLSVPRLIVEPRFVVLRRLAAQDMTGGEGVADHQCNYDMLFVVGLSRLLRRRCGVVSSLGRVCVCVCGCWSYGVPVDLHKRTCRRRSPPDPKSKPRLKVKRLEILDFGFWCSSSIPKYLKTSASELRDER